MAARMSVINESDSVLSWNETESVDDMIAVQMMKGGPSPLSDMTSVYATQRNLLASNYSGEISEL